MSAQFADASYSDVLLYAGRRDPAIWTGTYLASHALRLLTTGAPEASDRIEETVRVLHRRWSIAGDRGYLARFSAPADSSAEILATLPPTDAEVIRDVAFEGSLWHWRGRISRDQH